jgi:hypothetical protein
MNSREAGSREAGTAGKQGSREAGKQEQRRKTTTMKEIA